MDPRQTYRTRLEHFEGLKQSASRTFRTLGNVRLWLAVVAVALAFIAFGPGWVSPWWLALVAAVFVVIAVVHEQIDQRLVAANRGATFYDRALKRLDNHWAGEGNSGERFRSPSHLFADDLDLFGRASLFERISTARTSAGERTLADWLLQPGVQEEVVARQQAVAELRSRNDLREELALMGDDVRAAADDKAPARGARCRRFDSFPGARVMAFLLASAAVVTFLLFLAQVLSIRPFLVVLLGRNPLQLFLFVSRSVRSVASMSTPARDLQLLGLLVERLRARRSHLPA